MSSLPAIAAIQSLVTGLRCGAEPRRGLNAVLGHKPHLQATWYREPAPTPSLTLALPAQVNSLHGIGQDCVVVLPSGCRDAASSVVFFNFTTLDPTTQPYWLERWEVCCSTSAWHCSMRSLLWRMSPCISISPQQSWAGIRSLLARDKMIAATTIACLS